MSYVNKISSVLYQLILVTTSLILLLFGIARIWWLILYTLKLLSTSPNCATYTQFLLYFTSPGRVWCFERIRCARSSEQTLCSTSLHRLYDSTKSSFHQGILLNLSNQLGKSAQQRINLPPNADIRNDCYYVTIPMKIKTPLQSYEHTHGLRRK